MPDNYSIRLSAHNPGTHNIDTREDVITFSISSHVGMRLLNYGIGCINMPSEWSSN